MFCPLDILIHPDQPARMVQIWDVPQLDSLPVAPSLTIENRGGGPIAWNLDNERFAVVENSGVLVYDLTTNNAIRIDVEDPYALAWSPDGSQLAVGSYTIRIWETTTWQFVREIPVVNRASTLHWSYTGEHIFSGEGPDGLYLDGIPLADILAAGGIDTLSSNPQPSFILPREASIFTMVRSGNGRVLAVIYHDHRVRTFVDFFDSESGRLITSANLGPYVPAAIALSPTGDRLFWTDNTPTTGIYDLSTGENRLLSTVREMTVETILWNPTEDFLGWSMGSGLSFFNLNTDQRVGYLVSDARGNLTYEWSPDGQKIVTTHYAEDFFSPGVEYRTLQVWDVSNINMSSTSEFMTKPILTINDHGGGLIAWSPDGTRFAALELTSILVYDLTTQSLSTVDITETIDYRYSMQWSPDGRYLAIGGSGIHIWDTATWRHVQSIPTERVVSTLQWSFTGEHIFHNGGLRGLYLDETPLVDVLRETAAD